MTRSLTWGIALALAASSFAPAIAQEKKPAAGKSDEVTTTGGKSMKTLTVEGTVKTAQADGIVVRGKAQAKVGKESGKDREWAFTVNDKTTITRGQKTVMATELKAGDAVTVSYTEDGGKVIAQSVTVRDAATGSTPGRADVPAGKK